jgi:hypothetical protein
MPSAMLVSNKLNMKQHFDNAAGVFLAAVGLLAVGLGPTLFIYLLKTLLT